MAWLTTDLGVPAYINVKAELYRLLLYQNGDFFLPHRDTEKAEGMFATLVITLPSQFEVHELALSHVHAHCTCICSQQHMHEGMIMPISATNMTFCTYRACVRQIPTT